MQTFRHEYLGEAVEEDVCVGLAEGPQRFEVVLARRVAHLDGAVCLECDLVLK